MCDVRKWNYWRAPLDTMQSCAAVLAIVLWFWYANAENINNHHHPINNVCPTFEDYHTIEENERCWYNFAADSSAVSRTTIIKRLTKKKNYTTMRYFNRTVPRKFCEIARWLFSRMNLLE